MAKLRVGDLAAVTVVTPTPKRLTNEQVAAWNRDGMLYMPGVFSGHEIGLLKALVTEDDAITANIGGPVDSKGEQAQLFSFGGQPDDVMGAFVRIARLVEMTEDLLGGREVYHWHSKFSFKPPHSKGTWDWHQDYGSWYLDGCLWPDSLTAMIAMDVIDESNGCVQLVRGSHLAGRVDHMPVGKAMGADPDRVARMLEGGDLVMCEMQPGDVVFFHSNTLHASGPNTSQRSRDVFHISYNTAHSAPPKGFGYTRHQYEPLKMLPDDVLTSGRYAPRVDRDALAADRALRDKDRERVGNLYGYTRSAQEQQASGKAAAK
ncbi:MAG: phytanoyl-CoA dioxygenase family protein [Alphaproteobacteria bacterium]